MTPKFHPLRIREIHRETADCVSLSFDVPAALRSDYAFTQGQHLTLKATLDGEELRRNYSICASPADRDLRIAIKKVPGGKFSTFANEHLRVGDTLEVMTPLGKFQTPLDPFQRKHYVAFAAGSGITPVLSILKTTLQTEPDSRFTLFFGNRSTGSIIFREAIEGLKNRYMQRFSVHHILTKENPGAALFYGRITAEKCRELFAKILDPREVDDFFLCGPEPVIDAVRQALDEMEVPKKRVHFELFTSPSGDKTAEPRKWAPPAEDFVAHITVTLDAKTFSFDYRDNSLSLLDAAHRIGADLPFACKGGVCCTCKARLLSGEVEMEVNYGLEQEEVEAGYVLTCQSFPKTEKVELTFDE